MELIEGGDKLEVTRTLKDCGDIELFEQEAIKQIIDYKWATYGRVFFLAKFQLYIIFLLFYYIDVETMDLLDESGMRKKDWLFYLSKSICTVVNSLFFFYEIVQMKNDGAEYFTDTWNYFELLGNFLYQSGAILDVINDHVSDITRIIVAMSIIFTLAKMVYLIRVFRQLNFLVTMLITVIHDIFHFMVLFLLFLLTFAASFHALEVDISLYGRTPPLMAYSIAVLRCAMGDFSIIHMTQGFDLIDDPEAYGEDKYRFTQIRVIFTFCIFILCSFYIFIIFMNFLIAVIVQSYNKVINNKEAFDYQQRAAMINEREGYFTQAHLQSQEYFPKLLVVRKAKTNSDYLSSDSIHKKLLARIKNIFKATSEKAQEGISRKFDEGFKHLTSSIKVLEIDIQNVNREIETLKRDFPMRQIGQVDDFKSPSLE